MKMRSKPSIYLYPITPHTFSEGANDYILRKGHCLSEDFLIINSATRTGILDIVLKFFKTDVIYFNWIEDLADKRFGYLQVMVLFFVLIGCRLLNKKVIWFIHNNISHYPKNKALKKIVRQMMTAFADKTFTHSTEVDMYRKIPRIRCFDHPVEQREFIKENPRPEYDVLIWGTQSPYKGVSDLLRYNQASSDLQEIRFLIAGRFTSEAFYNEVAQLKLPNITIINRVIDDRELEDFFERAQFVLFSYKKNSVLSSGALAKTLSYGKTIFGPDTGAFKELAGKGLVHTYRSFDDLATMLKRSKTCDMKIDRVKISRYTAAHAWDHFKEFLVSEIKDVTSGKSLFFRRSMA
jgi:beta-1,4-mannosyltransferase